MHIIYIVLSIITFIDVRLNFRFAKPVFFFFFLTDSQKTPIGTVCVRIVINYCKKISVFFYDAAKQNTYENYCAQITILG